MRIFISAGEPSGDLHAANLIRRSATRFPRREFVGFGGPKMAEAGAKLLYPLVNLAVMWFVGSCFNINKFLRLICRAERYFGDKRPDAVVLIDYPGLHWGSAKAPRHAASRSSISSRRRSGPGRAGGSRRSRSTSTTSFAACRSSPTGTTRAGSQAEYVGHPYFDELAERELDEAFLAEIGRAAGPLVAILPGSRTQEVTRNLPIMLRAASKLARQRPDVRFAVACLH